MVKTAADSQLADRLEKQNLVERISNPWDRRMRTAVLSDKENNFVRQSNKARQSLVNEIPIALSDDQQDQISAALQLLVLVYQENAST